MNFKKIADTGFKCVSDFTALFSLEKKLFSWTYILKKTSWMTKILIYPAWNRFLKSETHFLSL